jgi:glycosyltransferase involved in cell wall biosynthesis
LHSRGQERQLSRLLKERPGPTVVSPHPLYQVFNKDRYTSSAARDKLGILAGQKTILFFGFIRKYKGLETLLRAMPVVKEYDPRILLLIVGEVWGGKREYNRYAALIKELNLEKNTLFINRYVHNEEVEIYFKACDFVILPYTNGTGSGILQIAYGMGRAVAATRISAFEDVVEEGRTGCLVPPADEQQLADAIVYMYKSGLLPKMEKEILGYKSRFEWSMMIDQINRIYTELQST